jgi:hypothetical protein
VALIAVLGILVAIAWIWLAIDRAPDVLSWLREGRDDIGRRLRRECESIARQVADNRWSSDYREMYIRDCIAVWVSRAALTGFGQPP